MIPNPLALGVTKRSDLKGRSSVLKNEAGYLIFKSSNTISDLKSSTVFWI